jgi:uncharacterized protein (TIGR03546 family)
MTLWLLKQFKKLLKALESGQTPNQLAGGFLLGLFMGMPPFFIGYQLIFLLLLLLLDVNMGIGFFAFAVTHVIALLLDPIAHKIGSSLLLNPGLTGFWTYLNNFPLFPYTHFNNTVMLGQIILSLIFAIPCFIGVKKFIPYYRTTLKAKLDKFKLIKAIKKSALFSWYNKLTS